ncbi:MAG: hypothetical protein KAI66_23095, partial [Lentisphaeria bacterium]|nr:hypothetical protein [Lentisphaeria bacterium]
MPPSSPAPNRAEANSASVRKIAAGRVIQTRRLPLGSESDRPAHVAEADRDSTDRGQQGSESSRPAHEAEATSNRRPATGARATAPTTAASRLPFANCPTSNDAEVEREFMRALTHSDEEEARVRSPVGAEAVLMEGHAVDQPLPTPPFTAAAAREDVATLIDRVSIGDVPAPTAGTDGAGATAGGARPKSSRRLRGVAYSAVDFRDTVAYNLKHRFDADYQERPTESPLLSTMVEKEMTFCLT